MSGLQLSARSVAYLLEKIFGPAIYDAPPFDHGPLFSRRVASFAAGPQPDPWQIARFGPQPDPWSGERQALALADAHLRELLALDRMGALLGEEVAGRALDQALRIVAEIDEICPRWPRWPKNWPPPPPPPPWWREEMSASELLVFGSRVLVAADLVEQGKLQDALVGLGEKALAFGVRG